MKMRMISHLCGKEPDKDLVPVVPPRPPPTAPVRKRKGPAVWQDPTATLEHEVPKDSRDRAEDTSILGREAEGEALRNITSKYIVTCLLHNSRDNALGYSWKFL